MLRTEERSGFRRDLCPSSQDDIRTVLSIAASMDLEVEHMDVKTAFLHGHLEEEIYMHQPEGFVKKGKENLV